MKKITLSYNAISTISSLLVIASIITGTAISGALIANRIMTQNSNNDLISFQEAIDIASAIPEVAEFLEENDIRSVSANLVETTWTVEFYASGLNYTEDYYYWINYAYIEINATNGEVLNYIVYTPQDANFTITEIITIAESIPEISYWLDTLDSYLVDAWYDGYEDWYVEFYASSTQANANVVISNDDGSVTFWEINDPIENAVHTEEEIIIIVEGLTEVQNWITDNPVYIRTIQYVLTSYIDIALTMSQKILPYYSEQIIETETNTTIDIGIWYVNYYASGEFNSSNWLEVSVDDSTGGILEISTPINPELTEAQVITIAETIPDVEVFLTKLTSYHTYCYFSTYHGYWNVYFYNDEDYSEYAYIKIEDPSGEILFLEINDYPDP
ncbi:MAG: hypothetical protein ACFFDW_13995, partial [Candidatus Thorarchaeota archaeon]